MLLTCHGVETLNRIWLVYPNVLSESLLSLSITTPDAIPAKTTCADAHIRNETSYILSDPVYKIKGLAEIDLTNTGAHKLTFPPSQTGFTGRLAGPFTFNCVPLTYAQNLVVRFCEYSIVEINLDGEHDAIRKDNGNDKDGLFFRIRTMPIPVGRTFPIRSEIDDDGVNCYEVQHFSGNILGPLQVIKRLVEKLEVMRDMNIPIQVNSEALGIKSLELSVHDTRHACTRLITHLKPQLDQDEDSRTRFSHWDITLSPLPNDEEQDRGLRYDLYDVAQDGNMQQIAQPRYLNLQLFQWRWNKGDSASVPLSDGSDSKIEAPSFEINYKIKVRRPQNQESIYVTTKRMGEELGRTRSKANLRLIIAIIGLVITTLSIIIPLLLR